MTSPKTDRLPHCWCGNGDLITFSGEYARCSHCETLVVVAMPPAEDLLVSDDDRDFYGRRYYAEVQPKHGFPPLEERARNDLPERCLHWLRTLVRYKLPPARILELGSAHGGFVALTSAAGFDATGLELSPWLADFARRTFGVPMLVGPVEQQAVEPHSLDVVALMDVLEHLPDPVATIRHCAGLLKPGGIFMIQTPRYREGKSHADMLADQDAFLQMLKEEQHLFLFSRQSVTRLLEGAGLPHVRFEEAIFSAYDMFLVAGNEPLAEVPALQLDRALTAAPSRRIVGALLDLDTRLRSLLQHNNVLESDRAARLDAIEQQGRALGELEARRNDAVAELEQLRGQMRAAEADREARLQVIENQGRAMGELEAERNSAVAELEQLRGQIRAAEADRQGHLDVIARLTSDLEAANAARTMLREKVEEMERRLSGLEAQVPVRLLRRLKVIH